MWLIYKSSECAQGGRNENRAEKNFSLITSFTKCIFVRRLQVFGRNKNFVEDDLDDYEKLTRRYFYDYEKPTRKDFYDYEKLTRRDFMIMRSSQEGRKGQKGGVLRQS